MGIFSWFRSRRRYWFGSHVPDGISRRSGSLATDVGPGSPRDEAIKRAAAADVAAVEEDDKYFGRHRRNQQNGL